jgi:hypothetical protein
MLDNKSINSFHQLFLVKIPFYLQFDHVLSLKIDGKAVVERHGNAAEKIDLHGQNYLHLRKLVMEVLRKGKK